MASAKLLSRYPWATHPFIVSAPMRIMSGPALAVAVSRAGGLGYIGPGAKTQDMMLDLEEASQMLLDRARTSSSSSSSSSPSTSASVFKYKGFPSSSSKISPLPIGVGFQLWTDDQKVAVATIEKFKPCAAWLYAPRVSSSTEEIDTWSRQIRHASPQTQIWIQIGTVKEAQRILTSASQPDVVVVQGAEAGGHGRANDGIGLISLFPEIADIFASSRIQIPLLAAGGIADGRGVAAMLALGAAGSVMGTRFLASKQARISRGYQDEIVRATDGAVNTTRTLLYNHLRGTYGWPEEYSPRTVINKSYVEHRAGGSSFEELKERLDEALKMGDGGWGPDGRLATYASASVGLIHGVKDAGDIVREVQKDAMERIRSLSANGKE